MHAVAETWNSYDAEAVLARAVWKASEMFEISQKDLAQILGVSAATLSRWVRGEKGIAPSSKEGELALLFVRMFRSLDALLGGNTEQCRTWLYSHNTHLQDVPLEKIRSVTGLVHVVEYLDAMRGKV